MFLHNSLFDIHYLLFSPRSTYSAGGQAIATRVSGDPESDNNGLFYIHSDHLGSATFMTHGNGHASEGLKVANSTKLPLQAAFSPFGEYRIQPSYPTSDITDRGFTGHKQNDEIGLIYMNARYYLGSVGRFISADTLIPYPNDPQSHNRYSYVRNRPLNAIDPTGHIDCPDPDAGCAPANTPPPDITQTEYEDTIIASLKEANQNEFDSNQSDWWYGEDEYSDWFSGEYSGCFMCHAAAGNGTTILTNEGLAIVNYHMEQAAFAGGAVIVVSTAVVVGGVTVATIITRIACADTNCTNELTTLYRAIGNRELTYLNRYGNYGSSPSASGKYFATTLDGAQQFANSSFNAGRIMTVTSTEIPTAFVNQGYHFVDIGGANESVFFAEQMLPYLYQLMTTPVIISGG